MDFTNQAHQDAAFNEIEGAITYGVETIGMDCISCEHKPWQVYFWLQRLHKKYPSTRFVVEPKNSDFIHTLAPMYFVAYRGQSKLIKGPHMIADFLNRGHEKWGSLQTARNSADLLVAHPDIDDSCSAATYDHPIPSQFRPQTAAGDSPCVDRPASPTL